MEYVPGNINDKIISVWRVNLVPTCCVAGVCSKEDADIVGSSLNDTLPTYIHSLMFAPNVEALCTEQQRQYWLPRCESMEVCNCAG